MAAAEAEVGLCSVLGEHVKQKGYDAVTAEADMTNLASDLVNGGHLGVWDESRQNRLRCRLRYLRKRK